MVFELENATSLKNAVKKLENDLGQTSAEREYERAPTVLADQLGMMELLSEEGLVDGDSFLVNSNSPG